jgi:XRE family transcriptional regulator, regulator of sulfur utilization
MQPHRSRRAASKTAEDLFGEVLREVRKKHGLSQEELAFQSGYHPTYIGQLERGRKSPSLRAIMRLSSALNTSGSELLARLESLLPKARTAP